MYYKQSGRYSLGGLLMGATVGIAASPILAYAYGRGLILISEAHFAGFATITLGAAIGAVSGYGMVWGSVRNENVTIAVSTVVAVVALYLSWAVWVAATLCNDPSASDVTWSELALHPEALWKTICLINQSGTWSLGDFAKSATHGTELWAYWLGEAAIVIGVAPSVALYVIRLRPFCEACGCWTERGAHMHRATPANLAQLKRHLETKDLEPLASLASANKENDLYLTLNSCPRCRLFNTLSMTHMMVTRRKWGRPAMRKNQIIRHLIVRPEQAETLRQLSAGGNSTPGMSLANLFSTKTDATKITVTKINSAAAGKK